MHRFHHAPNSRYVYQNLKRILKSNFFIFQSIEIVFKFGNIFNGFQLKWLLKE